MYNGPDMEACQGTSDGGWSRPGGWARGAAGGCRGHHYMLSQLVSNIANILVFRIECRTACNDDPPNHGPPLTSGEVMSSIS